MHSDKYQFEGEGLFFKHERSVNIPCNAYARHTHNMYELLYFINGDATQIIEDRKHKLESGDLVLISPQKYHFVQIDSPSDYERYDILLDNRILNIESIARFAEGMEVINLSSIPLARDILQKTDYYFQNLEPYDFSRVMAHLLSELFYLIGLLPQSQKAERFTATAPILSKALNYINDNIVTVSDVDEVARECFVSKSYLFRLFKKELHQTPKNYILEKRLLIAQSKILSGEKPTKVYTCCGFSDYTTFYRNYLDFFGYSPAETEENRGSESGRQIFDENKIF